MAYFARGRIWALLGSGFVVVACTTTDGIDDVVETPDGGPFADASTTADGGVVVGADGSTAGDGGTTDGGDASITPVCGRNSTPCDPGGACDGAPDCKSGVCQGNVCQSAAPADGVKNGDETDVDCGGTKAPACPDGEHCLLPTDCVDGVCTGTVCQAPTDTDGVKNGDETGVDCGGTVAPPCEVGQGCKTNADCDHLQCDPVNKTCNPASHTDGVTNDGETGVDCGGTAPNLCEAGYGCASNADCDNIACDVGGTNLCLPASSSDGIKNGSETDIDCGGGAGGLTNAPACQPGQACLVDGDCSVICNYAKKCVEAKSCRSQHGGDTCGPEGANESCCVSPPVGGVHLDKYNITAGRMRTFVTDAAINGNIKAYITANKPAWWDDTWTQYLPTQMDNGNSGPDDAPAWTGFYQDVGPYVHGAATGGNEGCFIRGSGARTYRLPDSVNTRIGDEQDYTQAFLDERPMQCTPMPIFAAFCAWDGAELADRNILNTAWGAATYPWGSAAVGKPAGAMYFEIKEADAVADGEAFGSFMGTPTAAWDTTDTSWANYNGNYWGGATWAKGTACQKNNNQTVTYCDQSIFVAPPGRFPNGNSASGHSDLAGNVFNMTLSLKSGTSYYWSRSGSWEGHGIPFSTVANQSNFAITNKYLATGARCVRP